MKEELKKFQLSLLHRIVIMNVIPATGDFRYLVIRKDLKTKLNPTQEEIEKYKIDTEINPDGTGLTTWDQQAAEKYTIPAEFTTLEFNEIKKSLKKLFEDKKAGDAHLELAVHLDLNFE